MKAFQSAVEVAAKKRGHGIKMTSRSSPAAGGWMDGSKVWHVKSSFGCGSENSHTEEEKSERIDLGRPAD